MTFKTFLYLKDNAAFGKTMEDVRKHGDMKLVITEARRNYLLSEQNYQKITFFSENLLAVRNKKTQIFMDKPVYLGLSILEIN